MYRIELHERFNQMFELFYRVGFWSRGEQATVKERRKKNFYTIYHLLLPISLVAGSIKSDSSNESIFLLETAILAAVMSMKLQYIIWKQKEIVELCQRIGFYDVDDNEEFTLLNRKLNIFINVAVYFFYLTFAVACATCGIAPFVGGKKQLFFNIGFPLDYNNSESAHWMAIIFLSTEVILTGLALLFYIIMWYLLLNCSLKYQVLGNQLKNMGVIGTVDGTISKLKISEATREIVYFQDVIAGIESHNDIYELFPKPLTY